MSGRRYCLSGTDLFAMMSLSLFTSFRSVQRTQINARRTLGLAVILAVADKGGAREVAATARRRIISTVSIITVSHDETEMVIHSLRGAVQHSVSVCNAFI